MEDEANHKKLLEAVQGFFSSCTVPAVSPLVLIVWRVLKELLIPPCWKTGCGRPGQTYSLFAGSGQTLSSGGAAQPTGPAAAAPAPASTDAAALRAVAKLS